MQKLKRTDLGNHGFGYAWGEISGSINVTMVKEMRHTYVAVEGSLQTSENNKRPESCG